MIKKRLSKALAAAGIASRRAAEKLIQAGKVTVNGEVVYLPQTHVDWQQDNICLNKQLVKGEQEKFYFMLNKPKGFICSSKPIGRKKLVIDLFQDLQQRLFTIGRLDRDTTGLLLVSNDGHFAHQVIHPSSNLTKEYLVKTRQEISHDHLVAISKGMRIERQWVKPKKVVKMRRGTLKITVKEGKKREVRLFVQQAGLTLLSLQRIRIGGLKLNDLPEGQWRELTAADRELIFN
ncbi:MAG: pseudouridine synthase [Chlamydiota bacterium]